jgi:hypothetical protein
VAAWRCQGTLFRFPLRTEDISSDITAAAYPPERVEALLATFQAQATRALLFLKSVSRIVVHIKRQVWSWGVYPPCVCVHCFHAHFAHFGRRLWDTPPTVGCASAGQSQRDVRNQGVAAAESATPSVRGG